MGAVKPRQNHKTVWCTCFFHKHDAYEHVQAQVWKLIFMQINYHCIFYVLFVDIFTSSFDDFFTMIFLIAVFLPASPFIAPSPVIILVEIFYLKLESIEFNLELSRCRFFRL